MAVKYFCDRCDKEKDIWDITLNVQGREFKKSLCQECIEELTDILKVFFEIEKPPFRRKLPEKYGDGYSFTNVLLDEP